MKKRIVTMMLVTAMAVSVAACGDTTEETQTEESVTEESEDLGELEYLGMTKVQLLTIRSEWNDLEEEYWEDESQWDEYAALSADEWPDEMTYYYGDGYDEYCEEISEQIAEKWDITAEDVDNIYLYTADWVDVQSE